MMLGSLVFLAMIAGMPESGEAEFKPTPAEAQVPELFQLEASRFAYTSVRLLETQAYSVSKVEFPSPIVTQDIANNTVHAEFFEPKKAGRKPAVVVLHILGADFALSRYIAARLADQGVAALFVKLPYYGERSGPARDRRFLSADIERTVLAMRQGICDVRRAAAWLASRKDVDPEKIGVAGVSLGGIVGSVALAVDPALKQGAFLLAGGNLAKILWEMPEGARYRKAWIDAGKTFADLETLTKPFDPLTHAGRLVGKRVFMMAGNVDEVIPPDYARALWEKAGMPPIVWYDCGHYSAVGFLLPAIRKTVEFLR